MNIVLLVATKQEIAPLLKKASLPENVQFPTKLHFGENSVEILISGPGSQAATYFLTRYLQTNDCDLAINAGIAGSYNRDLAIGSVVEVREEVFGDLGIDNKGQFTTLFEESLALPNVFPFHGGWLKNPTASAFTSKLVAAKGVTVNTSSGSDIRIEQLLGKFAADVETMEGAAFFHVCLMEAVQFVEIRAVSNFVEPRNKEAWNIPLAVENLNNELIQFFERIK